MPLNTYSKKVLRKGSKVMKNIILAGTIALTGGASAYTITSPATAEAKSTCTPHYLKGLKAPKNKLENMLEKERVYSSSTEKYPAHPRRQIVNTSLETEVEIYGQVVRLVFPNYVKSGDTIRHYNATGIDTYPAEEFECMVQDNVEYIKESAKLAMEDYKNTLKVILKAQEAKLKEAGRLEKDENLEDYLDMKIPGYEDLKLRDVLFTPDIKVQDFLPKTYYFNEIPALGVTYINTGIIDIDPKARMLDYINGWPVILVHEMTHNNPKLQSLPLLNKFDAELWASFPMLSHSDMTRLLGHQYLTDVRKLSKILFNFDSELAYEDMISINLVSGIEFESENKYEKLRSYMDRVGKISAAIREVAFDYYIPEFYTHPLYYMALNDFMNDKNAAFKLTVYQHFEPTLLGGPENTRDFIQENMEAAKTVSSKTMKKLNKSNGTSKLEESLPQVKIELAKRLKEMDPTQKEMLLEAAKMLGMPEGGSFKDLVDFGLRVYNLGLVEYTPKKEEVLIK